MQLLRKWRAIAFAPKNQKIVLLRLVNGKVAYLTQGYWDESLRRWTDGGPIGPLAPPTHWEPLRIFAIRGTCA